MSPQINALAQALLVKYGILMNSLNFHSGISTTQLIEETGPGSKYDITTGQLDRTVELTADTLTTEESTRISEQYNASIDDTNTVTGLRGRGSYENTRGSSRAREGQFNV